MKLSSVTSTVTEMQRELIVNRPQFDKELVIWDEDHKDSSSGFLFFTNRGKPMMETDVDHYFTRARDRFNEIYKNELPEITPHVCRHTFCSNMATRGMPLLMLKEIMGHSDVTTTANIYTHVGIDALSGEVQGGKNKNYVVYTYDREADIVALDEDVEQED